MKDNGIKMEFKQVAQLGAFLSKEYTEAFLKLIVAYNSISASEAASRIGLHIKTAQDFLEGLTQLGVLIKEEVYEKKRPYYRYSLKKPKIEFTIDFTYLFGRKKPEAALAKKIRERKNADIVFSIVGSNQYISNIVLRTGEGRERREKRINLTHMQGRFLYHLPFPSAPPMSVKEIMRKADVKESYAPEIVDLVEVLEIHQVLDVIGPE